jgi:hypothetical protein
MMNPFCILNRNYSGRQAVESCMIIRSSERLNWLTKWHFSKIVKTKVLGALLRSMRKN